MIEALITGKLIKDGEIRTSGTGKDYCLLIVKEGEERIVRVLLWGDDIERMSKAKRGDAVAVVGSLTASIWEGKVGLSMMAHRCLTAGERKPKRPATPDTPSQSSYRAAAHAQRGDGELQDDLPWN